MGRSRGPRLEVMEIGDWRDWREMDVDVDGFD